MRLKLIPAPALIEIRRMHFISFRPSMIRSQTFRLYNQIKINSFNVIFYYLSKSSQRRCFVCYEYKTVVEHRYDIDAYLFPLFATALVLHHHRAQTVSRPWRMHRWKIISIEATEEFISILRLNLCRRRRRGQIESISSFQWRDVCSRADDRRA